MRSDRALSPRGLVFVALHAPRRHLEPPPDRGRRAQRHVQGQGCSALLSTPHSSPRAIVIAPQAKLSARLPAAIIRSRRRRARRPPSSRGQIAIARGCVDTTVGVGPGGVTVGPGQRCRMVTTKVERPQDHGD